MKEIKLDIRKGVQRVNGVRVEKYNGYFKVYKDGSIKPTVFEDGYMAKQRIIQYIVNG